jgi:hypothetical protein
MISSMSTSRSFVEHSRFPNTAGTSSIRPNEDVQAVKIRFTKEFLFVSEKEFAKKIAHNKLEEISILDLVEILVCYERPFLDSYQLLLSFFR